jgi:hypothetical protein
MMIDDVKDLLKTDVATDPVKEIAHLVEERKHDLAVGQGL